MPRCLIIAGPNGAGKTTFAKTYLPVLGVDYFINADDIAADLSGKNNETVLGRASRVYLAELDARIEAREDFAFETTLSGLTYLKTIDRLKQAGWEVGLYYLALPNVEMSKARVAERVAHGGHDIPTKDIERRFGRSLRNLLNAYSIKVDKCFCYMAGIELEFVNDGLVFVNTGQERLIGNEALYVEIVRLANL